MQSELLRGSLSETHRTASTKKMIDVGQRQKMSDSIALLLLSLLAYHELAPSRPVHAQRRAVKSALQLGALLRRARCHDAG